MSHHRYRQRKVKREHTIIPGIIQTLEAIGTHPDVKSITPGRISRRARAGDTDLTFQYATETGLKLMAKSKAAVQEVFVVTDEPQAVLEWLQANRLINGKEEYAEEESTKPAATPRNRRRRSRTKTTLTKRRPQKSSNDVSQESSLDAPQASSSDAQEEKNAPNGPLEDSSKSPHTDTPGPSKPGPEKSSSEKQREQRSRTKKRKRRAKNRRQRHVWQEILKTHRELLDLERRLD